MLQLYYFVDKDVFFNKNTIFAVEKFKQNKTKQNKTQWI